MTGGAPRLDVEIVRGIDIPDGLRETWGRAAGAGFHHQ